ncbi:hypothetical protein N7471_002323 [Penicillium samsonianum]|uniref:uncharacterized protein n=1 Tax=Penicillium samsonianum TaxID=1882272 RepID=UPI00254828B8|nr:uncharacterized protein N7471_002323 [Penicillium samsonianum]KAJ6142870.1 hypothetical protein N7471_002323 [Penicillium samsonianum]
MEGFLAQTFHPTIRYQRGQYLSHDIHLPQCLSYDAPHNPLPTRSIPLHSTYTTSASPTTQTHLTFVGASPFDAHHLSPHFTRLTRFVRGNISSFQHSDTESSEHVLISAFSDFVISDNRRLASQPSYTPDNVFYDANSTYNKLDSGNAPAKPEQCHLNPASATTNNPTTANTVTGNPMICYNNIFTA